MHHDACRPGCRHHASLVSTFPSSKLLRRLRVERSDSGRDLGHVQYTYLGVACSLSQSDGVLLPLQGRMAEHDRDRSLIRCRQPIHYTTLSRLGLPCAAPRHDTVIT